MQAVFTTFGRSLLSIVPNIPWLSQIFRVLRWKRFTTKILSLIEQIVASVYSFYPHTTRAAEELEVRLVGLSEGDRIYVADVLDQDYNKATIRLNWNRMSKLMLCLAAALMTGCAANSGVIPMSQDSFMVSRQATTGFSGSGNLKAEAITEANQYCSSRNKTAQVVNAIEAQPPFIFGNYPKAEIQFKCV